MKRSLILAAISAALISLSAQAYDDVAHYRTVYSTAEGKYDFDTWSDGDFHKWQSSFRAELKERIGLTDIEQHLRGYKPAASLVSEEDCGSFTRERWTFRTEPDVDLPMIVLRPKNLKGRVPLVLAIQGHSKNPELFAGIYRNDKERASGEEGERNIGIQAVNEGYIAIVPTTRAFGATRVAKDIKKDETSSCIELSNRDRLVGRTLIGERVWDVSRIIDWAFESLPVDRTNVILTGNSGGGTVTVYAGAIDTRISQSLPGSAFCPYIESIGSIYHCACNYIPGILDLGEMQDVAGLTAPRLFRAIHGVKDNIFPIEATREGMRQLEKIYAAAGAPGRCSLYEGPEGHRYYKAGAWDFVRANLEPERPANVVIAPEAPFAFEPLVMHEFPSKDFPITKYGARKGDVKATTDAFRKAMAACSKAGGGRVVVPEGVWTCGAIWFKSGVDLHLSEGAVLDFIDDPEWYPTAQVSWEGVECMNYSPLIYAFECENIAISGPGKIEPRMEFWKTWFGRPEAHIQATRQLYAYGSTDVPVAQRIMNQGENHMRPHLIHFNRCSNVQLSGFRINGSPFWTIHLLLCKDIWVHGLDSYAHGHNNDGIDFEMSSHAVVEDCVFDQGDDGIVLKAGRNRDAWRIGVPTSNIVVRRCEFKDTHSLMGVGSELSGGIRNIYLHDCGTSGDVKMMYYIKTNERRGGVVENIHMDDCWCGSISQMAFSIRTDVLYQWRDIVPTFVVKPTVIRNINMRNCSAVKASGVCEILGDAREPVRGVTLFNVKAVSVEKFFSHCENVYDLSMEKTRVLWKK